MKVKEGVPKMSKQPPASSSGTARATNRGKGMREGPKRVVVKKGRVRDVTDAVRTDKEEAMELAEILNRGENLKRTMEEALRGAASEKNGGGRMGEDSFGDEDEVTMEEAMGRKDNMTKYGGYDEVSRSEERS